jgi:phage tail-like protein
MVMDERLRQTMNATFRFVVEIDGVRHGAFTECSLPTVEWEVEEIKEGGLNSFVHQLPGRRKGARLTLKNGVGTSELLQWYLDTMDESFDRRAVTVTLLDVRRETVMTWSMLDAFPVKWAGPQLKADENGVAIQTLEFAFGDMMVQEG